VTLAALVLAQCFVVSDPAPGWKQVALPATAPHLAGPVELQQFRSAGVATVTHEVTEVLRAAWRAGAGRHAFEFTLPQGATTLSLRFAQPLDSAKVDAVVDGPRGRQVLLDERRVNGALLVLRVPLPDATRALVTVHSHLRGAPSLEAATVERAVTPRHAPDFPEQLRVDNSLYVLSAGGPLTLCERPGQAMTVAAASLQAPVRAVALTPAGEEASRR
jgi:hypothetical protein